MEMRAQMGEEAKVYFVMNRSEDSWVRVSEEYHHKDEAMEALSRLRRVYPFARLGGARTD